MNKCFFLLLLLLPLTSYVQNTKFVQGQPFKLKEGVTIKFLSQKDSFYYFSKYDRLNHELNCLKIDRFQNLVGEVNISLKNDEAYYNLFNSTPLSDGNAFFFTQGALRNDEVITFCVDIIDLNSFEHVTKKKELYRITQSLSCCGTSTSDPVKLYPHCRFGVSADARTIVFACDELKTNNSRKLSIKVLNEKFEVSKEEELEVPADVRREGLISVTPSNNGSILLSFYADRKTANTDQVQYFFKDEKLTRVNTTLNTEDLKSYEYWDKDEFCINAIKNAKNTQYTKELLCLRFDEWGDIKENSFEIDSVFKELKDRSIGLKLIQTLNADDGSTLFIFEDHSVMQFQSGSVSDGTQTSSYSYLYDFYILLVDSSLQIKWVQKVDKFQRYSPSMGISSRLFSSGYSFVSAGKLFTFFLDNESNYKNGQYERRINKSWQKNDKTVLVSVEIDLRSGEQRERNIILPHDQLEYLPLAGHYFYSRSSGELIAIFNKGRKSRFGKFQFQ